MDSDFDWSGFDWSDFNSRYLGLPFGRASYNLHPPTIYKSHHLLTYDEIYRSLPSHKAHFVPAEIFSEVFLYTIQANPLARTKLMLVCRHWHNIILSTPGIHSQLRIHRETKKKDVERFGRRWLLDVTVDPEHVPVDLYRVAKPDFDHVEFCACFMVAAEAASRWRSLALLSLPSPGEYNDLQIIHPLQHLESFKLATSCGLGNFLEPLLNAIATTVTPRFTVMEVFHPDAALYLLQPAHFQIFSSLTTLRLICKRTQNPVDVLTSLHRLEIFEAHRLSLPMYPLRVELPLVQTLRVLHLKSVSVQWMADRVFLALKECSIIFPHHADTIQSVHMPSCSILKYDSNDLGALENFRISSLRKLEIKCGQWNTWRGTLQLAALHSTFAAQSLAYLHLDIKCSELLLAYMLRLVPDLEELWMGLSSPYALSSAFFSAFAAGRQNKNSRRSSQTVFPLGRNLRMLHLHYKRWLRGPERDTLIPVFGAIVASHSSEEQIFTFRLSYDEGSKSQEWNIHEPVERFDFEATRETVIGVPSPDGIVPLSRVEDGDNFKCLRESEYLPPPRESEYITTNVFAHLPIDFFLSFRSLQEVKMPKIMLKIEPDTHFSLGAPLFHTLKVLVVACRLSSSFLAGHTFHKLERFKEAMAEDPGWASGPFTEYDPLLTEMPICTRLVVWLSTLATLKLPQIRELCVEHIDYNDHIWEKRITVNANLSGLKLLHVLDLRDLPSITFTKVLGSLPALESLIIGVRFVNSSFVNYLGAFVPMKVPGPSELNQTIWEGPIFEVLCPKLESLQIEGFDLTNEADLMPVLEKIVTLRAAIGSPLKSFTFYLRAYPESESKKWQLVGRDKSFRMEEVVPAEGFRLDI